MLTTILLPLFFFFNDTATTEIYTLSLHDALPIYVRLDASFCGAHVALASAGICTYAHEPKSGPVLLRSILDRKSTRLNSSHTVISYAVFCLKKKKKHKMTIYQNYKEYHKM